MLLANMGLFNMAGMWLTSHLIIFDKNYLYLPSLSSIDNFEYKLSTYKLELT
jgi:hypothetical protein